MPMEEALVARIVADEALGGLVGDRVSWFDRQRGDPVPSISLSMVSPGREWTHAGPDELDEPRVRFDCWARIDTDVVAVKRAALALMETEQEVEGVRFYPAELAAERWIDEGEQTGGEGLVRIQQEFLFFHEEV